MRWNTMPKRRMQMRLATYFVAMASFAAFFQVFLTDSAISRVVGSLPNDSELALQLLPDALHGGLVWTLAVVVPIMLGIGAVVTLRVAGPAIRLQQHFDALARDDVSGPCRLRDGDDLQSLCAAANRAVEAITGRRGATPRPTSVGHRESGFAIIVALITIVILTSTIITAVMSFQSHSTQVERRGEDYELEVAVESVTDLAIHEIWSRFRSTVAGGVNPDSVEGFRDYLSSIGANDQAGVTNPPGYDVLATLGLDFDSNGTKELSNVNVDELRLVRIDDASGTEVRLTATVSSRSRRAAGPNAAGWVRSIETSFLVEPDLWGGLEFALLANNVNCILCHTTVDSTERFYANSGGPYERVKVGTIERLMMRDDADSRILGTLYAGGPITDKTGLTISPSDWASHTLRSVQIDNDSKVVEDVAGDPVSAPMQPADGDVDENGRLYEHYSSTAMVDGELPSSFPPPFPDDGGLDPLTDDPTPTVGNDNRTVDDNEFYAATKEFHGTISGGRIYVLDPLDSIVTNADLAVAMSTSNKTSLTSNTSGQVFLTGTASDPIQLNGSVAVDGNLVIRGHVKGEGQIWVRGNAYAPTDLMYLDGNVGGNRTYGTASDGSENLLVITTGGNLLIGNPMMPHSTSPTQASFVQMELATFNRNEWMRTQPTLPGASGPVTNLAYDPTHVPRYYAMTNGEPIGIFSNTYRGWFDATGSWHGEEHPKFWDATWLEFADPSDPTDPILYDASGNSIARVQYVTSGNSWISDAQLERMFDEANVGRPAGPLTIDMFAYTNNAIFGVTSKHAGNTGGELLVNGGIVAADVGLLATEGIQLNYDRRAAEALRIQGNESVTIRRTASVILR